MRQWRQTVSDDEFWKPDGVLQNGMMPVERPYFDKVGGDQLVDLTDTYAGALKDMWQRLYCA